MIEYLIPPLTGAFIGYVTNWLAIKMLFRPYNEVRMFGIKMPFTPGLIPKRRDEIANSIAKVIRHHLINPENLHRLFMESSYKEVLENKLNSVVEEIVNKLLLNLKEEVETKVKISFLSGYTDKILQSLSDKIKPIIMEKSQQSIKENLEKHIEEELPQLLASLDVEKVIYETLSSIDIKQLEDIVLGFSEKQLKHITYLGGVIGFFIGLLQLLFNY
ncbi:DUF445 domain-containing protein [Sulfurihydrogenibium subterraneum]|uniref:DUF445 domain-containing protein n=1 Tax=Sulfurihydrogenibium subterraneum TaxID=171121 RepID=UPI00048D4CF6|nr:DUF445 family protein [Sulfurihydrogenibium subterraneum]